jgi:hypothetical protein
MPRVSLRLCSTACVAKLLNLTGSDRNEKQRHTDIKTQSWGRETCTFLVGYVSTYLSQSVYFIGQFKGMNQAKYTSAILLI